ncbi:MAG: 6-phosphogluconolactonase [Acidobacteriota bacterium]
MPERRQVIVCHDEEDIFVRAADLFTQLASESVAARGRFSVALSGGNTPHGLYTKLASDLYRNRIDWSRVHLFWGDERSVPVDHKDSNYRMANEALISKISIPSENIYRMSAEEADIGTAAANYEATIRRFFNLQEGSWPRFDLILLGMGDDGHTASLFPGTQALAEKQRIVVKNWVEKFNTNRMTLTAPAINHGRNILFMTAGEKKRGPLKEVLVGVRNPELYPSQLIQPLDGKLIWLVDEAATGGEKY